MTQPISPQMLVLYRDTQIEFWDNGAWKKVRDTAGWQELGGMI